MRFTTKDEILSLLGNASETRTLEFKREVHLNTTEDKKEFLRDITALANTDGGYLIIGIEEENEVATAISPIADPQAFSQKALDLLQHSVKPQIFGLRVQTVEIEPKQYVIVVYVPASWNRPHMVILKGERSFWGRNDRGKYPLDVATLRALFLWGEALEERLERFRAKRVAWLLERDTEKPYALLHFVPFSALRPGRPFIFDEKTDALFYTVGEGYFRANFEGRYKGSLPPERFAHYVQIFRTGAIEVGTGLFWEGKQPYLNLGALDDKLSKHWLPALWRYWQMGIITPPFAWTLSLLNVQGLQPPRESPRTPPGVRPGDRPHLLLPLQVLEAWDKPEDALEALIPLLDQTWQAFGAAMDPYWTDGETWRELHLKFISSREI